jgi:hypothetical protein
MTAIFDKEENNKKHVQQFVFFSTSFFSSFSAIDNISRYYSDGTSRQRRGEIYLFLH